MNRKVFKDLEFLGSLCTGQTSEEKKVSRFCFQIFGLGKWLLDSSMHQEKEIAGRRNWEGKEDEFCLRHIQIKMLNRELKLQSWSSLSALG